MATYLVGGAVRDLLLGHPPRDWDVITTGDPDRLAEELSRGTGGVFFVMDEDNQVYRVVLPHGHVVIDVAGIKGSLEEDLQRRDFTINAMAVPITPEELLSAMAGRPLQLQPEAVIDPFGGQEDLAQGVVRALGLEVLEADPVRTLRAVRMAAAKEFVIEPRSVNWIGLTSHLLRQVAGERIRDELFAILARPRSAQYLRQLVQLGLWREMVPDAAAAGWQRGMAWVERLEDMEAEEFALLGEWAPVSALRLRQATVYPRTRLQLLKLVAALGVTGAAGTQAASALGERLSLGKEERNLLARLPDLAPAAAALVQAPEPSCPELYRLLRAAGDDIALVTALAAAVLAVAEGDPQARGLQDILEAYHRRFLPEGAAPWVTGADLVERFGLTPSPLVGELVEEVREMRFCRRLAAREEAFRYVEERLHAKGG